MMSLSIQSQNHRLCQKALNEKNIEHPIKSLLKKNATDSGAGLGAIIESAKSASGEVEEGERGKRKKAAYPESKRIPLFLDNAGYCTSKEVKEAAPKIGIKLHYLPPYRPNLNPIERLWTLMNEKVRNNKFFTSPKSFRDAIEEFFERTWSRIAPFFKNRINDHF